MFLNMKKSNEIRIWSNWSPEQNFNTIDIIIKASADNDF
jgi:hypothetical protein